MFETHRRELLGRVSTGHMYTARKETVFTTWEISFKSIQSQDDAAGQLMLILAFLHHESPWEGLFHLAAGAQTSNPELFPCDGDFYWLIDLCSDKYRFKSAVGKILSFSLAKRGPLPGSLYLHPLVHAWGRDRLNTKERFRKQVHALAIIGQALFYTSKMARGNELWRLRLRILHHADASLSFAKSDGNTSDFASLFGEPALASSIFQIANLYYDFGRLKQAEDLLSSLLTFSHLPTPDEVLSESRLKLADVLVLRGRHEEAEQRYKDLYTSTHVSDDIRLQVRAGLGRVYWIMCQYNKSQEHLEAVIESVTHGSGRLGCLGQQAASNLALIYWHTGKLQDALNSLDKVIAEISPGAISTDNTALEHLYRRAMVFLALGRLHEAVATFTTVFASRKSIFGFDNLETCQAANALGLTYLRFGEYKEAREHLDVAWSGQERLGLGMGHPAVLRTLSNYGRLNYEEGLYDEAYECLARASQGESKYGERHHSYLCVQIELAVLETDRGNLGKALDVLSIVQKVLQEDYPPEKPELMRASCAAANALIRLGDLEKAEMELTNAILVAIEHFEPENCYLLDLKVVHARLRHEQNRGAEAVADLEATIERLGNVTANDHPKICMAKALLGQICVKIGRKDKGLHILRSTLKALAQGLGEDHPKTREVIETLTALGDEV